MMRVLFVSPEFPPNILGGVGIYSYYIIKYLLQIGKDMSIDVLTLSGETAIGKDFENLPLRVIKLRRIFSYHLRTLEFYIKATFFIYKNRNKYNLIHDNYNMTISFGIPVIYTVHTTMLQESWYYEFLKHNCLSSIIGKSYFIFLHCLEIMAFKKASSFIVPSEELKEHLKAYFSVKKDIFVIRHGIDSNLFKPKDDILKKRKYNIAFVGRDVSRKGLKYLFKALELLENRDLNIAFCSANIKKSLFYINKSKQNPRHKFYLKDSNSYFSMPSIYLDSDIVVLPSLYESFGFVALEAIACTTPVIISRVGGLKEIIENRVGGIFVQPKDPGELARTISCLLDRPDERIRIGLSGRERIVKDFSWHSSAMETYNLYSSIFNKYKNQNYKTRIL